MKKAEAMTLRKNDRVMVTGVGTNHPATVISVGVEAKVVLIKYDVAIKSKVGVTSEFWVSPSRIERMK